MTDALDCPACGMLVIDWEEHAKYHVANAKCKVCGDSGIKRWEEQGIGYWDVCACKRGKAFAKELDAGIADIAAGRVYKWEDIKRERFPGE